MALMTSARQSLQKISDTIWELPPNTHESMRVPARFYATEKLVNEMDEAVFEQVANVAALPGIVNYALCMPDADSHHAPVDIKAVTLHRFSLEQADGGWTAFVVLDI